MKTFEILLIALGLAMDAFAVSIAGGAVMKKFELRAALKMGLFFGGFQTFMPVLGWLAGTGMKSFIAGWDHWLAFGLLALVGGKMIHEALAPGEGTEDGAGNSPFETGALLVLALATSIDALAVGVTFSLLSVSIVLPVIVIGLVTFVLSVAGVRIGVQGGGFFGNKMEIFGGLILIGIGSRILLEHLLRRP
ncbi:MAG: manganese efflux pump MntP family protein [Elusimicrobiales bacterium]|jgi:putative Mn2+ efflux pump MntP